MLDTDMGKLADYNSWLAIALVRTVDLLSALIGHLHLVLPILRRLGSVVLVLVTVDTHNFHIIYSDLGRPYMDFVLACVGMAVDMDMVSNTSSDMASLASTSYFFWTIRFFQSLVLCLELVLSSLVWLVVAQVETVDE